MARAHRPGSSRQASANPCNSASLRQARCFQRVGNDRSNGQGRRFAPGRKSGSITSPSSGCGANGASGGDGNACGRLGGPADRAASLAQVTEQLREGHRIEYSVRWHAPFTCHLNTPMHMVEFSDGVGIWIDAENAAVFERFFMPAPIEIEPPGMSVYLNSYAVFGAGLQDFVDVDLIARPSLKLASGHVTDDCGVRIS